jgi:hypothetical protein
VLSFSSSFLGCLGSWCLGWGVLALEGMVGVRILGFGFNEGDAKQERRFV